MNTVPLFTERFLLRLNGKVVSQKIIKGEWVAFKNGKEIKRYSGNMQPGTKGFKY